MTRNQQQARRRRPPLEWWMRLFASLLFVYGINYTPVHLALEAHWGGFAATTDKTGIQPVILGEPAQDDDSHHAPHLALEHLLRGIAQARFSFVSFDACVVSTTPEAFRAQQRPPLFLTERQNPPGLRPPDPLQPRAPPLA